MSRDHQSAGHPLRIDPDQFSKSLPEPTRILNAELNKLISAAGLTRKQAVMMGGLDLTDKQCSRQMGERRAGPTPELFEAVLTAAAHELRRPLEELGRTYRPMLAAAQAAAAGSTPPANRVVPDTPAIVPDLAAPHTPAPADTLVEKTAWLANLLVANEERRAAAQLGAVFGQDKAQLVETLVKLGALDPGMVAALLEEIRRRDGAPRSTGLLDEIRKQDERIGTRIAAVPLGEELGRQPTILESDPARVFGLRMAALIRNGHIDQARRETVARAEELARGTHNDSVLAGIIEGNVAGPSLADTLLTVMAEDNCAEMLLYLVQLLRHVRAAERFDLLCSLDEALSPEMRGTIVRLLGNNERLPNNRDLDSPELRDFATFMKTLRENFHRLIAVITDEPIITFPDLAAGHLVESIPNFEPVLGGMVTYQFERTVQLLARSLTDWNSRVQQFDGYLHSYPPVTALARAVLGLATAPRLTAAMLTRHPASAALLFDAMQNVDDLRFPVLLADLTTNHVTTDTLARLALDSDKEPQRLRIFEKLVKDNPLDADTIMRRIAAEYSAEILPVLAKSGQDAPRFTERMIELLNDPRTPGTSSRRAPTPSALPLSKLPSAHRTSPPNRETG
ncbi:hypothetical protein [Nocardia suismassiliense]|uniref:hypothetical protein n=1 Tax=Nocardia suismassiliense TaxID=2077092 RepID=UPI000D1EC9C8|nr:hypothetical protein [Nocardia suismassiliense]